MIIIYFITFLFQHLFAQQYLINQNFEIYADSQFQQDYVAKATFQDQININGWTFLEIQTLQKFDDFEQLQKAGYLEGYIMQSYIWNAYRNFIQGINHNDTFNNKINEYVEQQIEFIQNTQNDTQYWNLAKGLLQQVQFMHKGYLQKITDHKLPDEQILDFAHFYYLTNMGDLEDVTPAFSSLQKSPSCQVIVKLKGDKLFTAHSTHNMYNLMLRVMKTYDFKLNNKLVKNQKILFSSRPGDISSKDDFYVIENKFVVTETSLLNFNQTNYNFLNPSLIPFWIRINIANRVASDGLSWSDSLSQYNSGTHNCQWIFIDYAQFEIQKHQLSSMKNVVFLIEQFFNVFEYEDITQNHILKESFISSQNVPYFNSSFEISGYQNHLGYNYFQDPKLKMIQQKINDVNSMDDMKSIIRHNNNETGDPCNAISPRCDLKSEGSYIFGGVDAKVLDDQLLQQENLWIINGPSNDGLPNFQFSDSDIHYGLPQKYAFNWILYSDSIKQNNNFLQMK